MKTILAFFCFITVFASCDLPRYAYSPAAHNVPILTKQGDSKIAAYYSTNGTSTDNQTNNSGENKYSKNTAHGFDLQGAVAVTNSVAVQASYFYRDEKTNSDNDFDFKSTLVKYKRNHFELGGGFFTPIDTKKHLFFQAFAGFGLGKTTIDDKGIDISDLAYSRFYDVNITKFYLEPSITFHAKEIFKGSFTTKASFVKFHNIKTNYSFQEKQDFKLDSLDRFGVLFLEPAFVGSFGFNKLPGLRIEFQAGACVLWDANFISYRKVDLSLGLVFDIRKLIKGPAGKSKD